MTTLGRSSILRINKEINSWCPEYVPDCVSYMSGIQPQAKKNFFFFEVVAFRGAWIKAAAPCIATSNAELWHRGAEDGGKAVISSVNLLPAPPRCEGWSQVPLGALQVAAQEVNWGQLCYGSCWQAVRWLRPLGAQLEGDTPEDVSFFSTRSPHKPWASAQHGRWLPNPQVLRGHPKWTRRKTEIT